MLAVMCQLFIQSIHTQITNATDIKKHDAVNAPGQVKVLKAVKTSVIIHTPFCHLANSTMSPSFI